MKRLFRLARRGQLWLQRNAARRGRWTASFCLWLVLLWIESSIPGGGDEGGLSIPLPPGSDKVVHFLLFALGGFCLLPVLKRGGSGVAGGGWRWGILWTAIAMALLGFLDEWHQKSTPGRSGGDLGDWTADVCGGAFGAIVFWLLTRRGPEPESGVARARLEEGRVS